MVRQRDDAITSKEVDLIASYLETHPFSTALEIRKGTRFRTFKIYTCLSVLNDRGLLDETPDRPAKYVLQAPNKKRIQP
jgi:hypothetical protein